MRIPAEELRESFTRSSGPGGQHVNKVATKVELRWTPADSTALSEADRVWLLARLLGRLTTGGELIVVAAGSRDQVRNRREARDKLAALVRSALARPKRRKKTRPTRASKERRLSAKRRRGEVKRGRKKPAAE